MITTEQLAEICPHAGSRIGVFLEPLNAAMAEFEISTLQREQFFIAQVAHESGEFRYVHELASGAAYEGRADLGNVQPGDGIRYRGRGLIQITGRTNYDRCGSALDLDLLSRPELLEEPINASRSATWFWKAHGLNEIADFGDFIKATRRINGGINGLADRQAYLDRAQRVLV